MSTGLRWTTSRLSCEFIGTIGCVAVFSGFPGLAQPAALPSRPVWTAASNEPYVRTLRWTAVEEFGAMPAEFLPVPARFDPAELTARPRVEGPYKGRGIFGVGGGVRAGVYTGDPTNAVLTTRFGYKLDNNFSLSLRPTNIFSNNNNDNNNNNFLSNSEFRLPLTLDLFHGFLLAPYIGGGVATNTDGLGYTDGMFTGGLDINITKYLTIGLNVNYIYQANIDDTDWEALGMLYLRF
ncbi:MAG: hypothetical protein ACK6AD_05355 [Cyanobacteriota bacterium]|jgi:hypothetical protein